MDYVSVLGRILLAAIFIVASPRHFTREAIAHATDLGVPFASVLVPLSGVMALVGGLSVATGYLATWGAWMLVAFLVPVTWQMHAFWKLSDPQAIHTQQGMFMKNVALIGALLLLARSSAAR